MSDETRAPFIDFEQFRAGLARGAFRIVVNPDLAQPFVAQRVNAAAVTIAIVGCGIAAALAGHPVTGALLVALGIAFRRVVKWQAPKIVLHLASHLPSAYADATANGVLEVRRR